MIMQISLKTILQKNTSVYSLVKVPTDKHSKPGFDIFLNSFINTKKAFKKLYMFYFETFRIILNPSSVKK